MKITEEHKRIMNIRKKDNMKLIKALKKTEVAKKIIYLKKMNKRRFTKAIIDKYLRPKKQSWQHPGRKAV